MQKVKPNLILQLLIAPVLLIIDFILARYYPSLTLRIYQAHWLYSLFILILIFCPISRKRLAPTQTEKPRFKKWQALSLIWIFQLSIMATFAGMTELIQVLQPELKAPISMFNSLWVSDWGLFPWVAMSVMGGAYAYYAYIKQQDAFNSRLSFPFLKTPNKNALGITADVCARLNTTVVLMISLMMGALSLAWTCTHLLGIQLIFGLNLEAVVLLTIIFLLVAHPKLGARLFDRLIQRDYPISFILLAALLLIASLLILSSWLLQGVSLHSLTVPHWLFDGAPLEALLNLFLAFWALAWVYSAGVFIAYVSRGYSLLQLFIASLSLPLLCSVLMKLPSVQYSLQFPPIVWIVLGLIGSCSLIYGLTHDKSKIPMLMQVYVAANDQIKTRKHRLVLVGLIKMSMALIYLYLPGGFLLLALVSVALGLPAVIYLLCVLVMGLGWIRPS